MSGKVIWALEIPNIDVKILGKIPFRPTWIPGRQDNSFVFSFDPGICEESATKMYTWIGKVWYDDKNETRKPEDLILEDAILILNVKCPKCYKIFEPLLVEKWEVKGLLAKEINFGYLDDENDNIDITFAYNEIIYIPIAPENNVAPQNESS
jgi:hypothetical protein